MFKKILKWTGIVILSLIVAVTTVTAFRQDLKYEAPYPDIKASADSAVIARGRHIVVSAGHCINCHSTKNPDSILALGQEVALTGGVTFKLPLGEIYSKNITPDLETGIGKYSDGEIARALRYGVHPDGTAVFDFMAFHDMSDEDLTAVISYLRSRPAVINKVPDHSLNAAGKMVKAFMVKPVGPSGPVPKVVKKDSSAAYGKYLALSVAECSGCHTQRDMAGAFVGEPFAGGNPFVEEGKPTLTPPNLTPDSTSRIFGWTEEDFIRRFRMGAVIPHSHMPWNAYRRMHDYELKAIYNYLKTLRPAKTPKQEGA